VREHRAQLRAGQAVSRNESHRPRGVRGGGRTRTGRVPRRRPR
jgi:hypothetical protein